MNSYVDLSGGGGSYATDLARLQRQQQMADYLQQQALEPVQAPQGAVAPISFTNVLAKALQGYAARKQNQRIDERFKGLQAQDQDSANALVRQLTQQTNKVGTTDIAAAPMQISNGLPGAPVASAQMPGVQGTGVQQQGPSQQEQMAALLSAQGGPQTQAVRGAMLPQIMQRQNMDYQREQNWQDKLREREMPLSTAAGQQIDRQNAGALQLAREKNALPMDAYQQAQVNLEAGKQREMNNYRNQMMGAGLTADGEVSPLVKADVQNIIGGYATLQNIPKERRGAVSMALANAPKAAYSQRAQTQFTLASDRITAPLRKLPQFELTANGLPYIQRIKAALKAPGSVSDQDLLDSLTKLNTAGNAITDAQVRLVTDGKSFKDWFGVMANKFKTGGVLSPDQRQQIAKISDNIYAEYRKGYEPVYKQATEQLRSAGIPEMFWTIPDLNKLSETQSTTGGGADPNVEAKAWLAANPNDPRAAAVRAKLGMK